LQIFSGNPSQGLKEPEFMKLLGSIPTTWDETMILDGRIGEYIITARRKGTDWFIAALNNSVARDITLKFDFLNDGNFKTTICKDGVNAHNYGSDYEMTEKNFNKNDSQEIHLAPGGGFLLKLEKIK
jgi:alpha-glucosidase